MKHYDAYIFDMDGTLVDNMMAHHKTWQIFLEELGLSMTLEEVHQTIHGVNVEIMEKLFPNKYSLQERIELSAEKERRYRENAGDYIETIEGAIDFLNVLKDFKIPTGIGTAAPQNNMEFAVDKLGLAPYFQTYVHSGSVSKGKPDPEVYYLVAKNLGVKTENSIIFEDTPTGARAASASGADVMIVTTTHRPKEFVGITNIIGFIEDYTEIKKHGFMW